MATTVEKKIKGPKRHIGVDIEGHLLHVEVSPANIHEYQSRRLCDWFCGAGEGYPTIQAASGDAGYRGTTVDYPQTIILDTPVHISTQIQDPILGFCRSVGLLNEPLHGSITIADYPKIMLQSNQIIRRIWFESLW